MDHPAAVTHLAVLDSVPIVERLDRADARFAAAWWHWFFFAQPDKPERAINADPEAWYGARRPAGRRRWGRRTTPTTCAAIRDPATVRAMLEDYRAGLGVDRAADEADRAAGRRIACPTLVLWSCRDDLEELHGDPLRDLGGLDDRPARRRTDRQRPPHGRGRTRGAGRRAHPLPRDVIMSASPGYGGDPTREERSCRRRRRAGSAKQSELPSTLQRSPKKAQRTFAKAHDSAADEYGDEKRANQVAWAAVKHTFEKVGDHWEKKDGEEGPLRRAGRGARQEPKPKGGVDANATKDHLLTMAKKLGVSGRSKMKKKELVGRHPEGEQQEDGGRPQEVIGPAGQAGMRISSVWRPSRYSTPSAVSAMPCSSAIRTHWPPHSGTGRRTASSRA